MGRQMQSFLLSTPPQGKIMLEKHTSCLAYLWEAICGALAQWTVHDYGALIGNILGIGMYWVNRHFRKKSE